MVYALSSIVPEGVFGMVSERTVSKIHYFLKLLKVSGLLGFQEVKIRVRKMLLGPLVFRFSKYFIL